MTSLRPEPSSHFAALDGLRFVCCTWVVVGHAFVFHPWAPFMSGLSGAGVDVFFALSGFLITRILLLERERHGRVDLLKFYARRSLRIWPVYYLSLAVVLVGTVALGDRFTSPLGAATADMDLVGIAWRYGLFVANVLPTAVPTSLDVLWSICVEEQFYLVFPLLWVRSNRRTPVLRVAALGLAVAWIVRIVLAFHSPGDIYRNPVAHADHLLLGSLLAQLAVARPDVVAGLARKAGRAGDVLALGLLMLLVAFLTERTRSPFEWWASYLASAVLSTALVGLLAFGGGALRDVLSRTPVVYLGTLTYAGYVFHIYPLAVAWFVCARLLGDSFATAFARSLLATAGTFLVAWASRRFLEDPFLRLKSRLV